MQENITNIEAIPRRYLGSKISQEKRNSLTFKCNHPECIGLSGDIRKDSQCFSHLMDTLYQNRTNTIHQLTFEKIGHKITFNTADIRELRELSLIIQRIKNDVQHISEVLNLTLNMEKTASINHTQMTPIHLLNQNPFQLFTWLKAVRRGLANHNSPYYNTKLRKHKHTLSTINKILKPLQSSALIKQYDQLDDRIKKGDQQSILSILLNPAIASSPVVNSSQISKDNLTILEKYVVTPFEVTIYVGDQFQLEPLYVYSSLMDVEPYRTICKTTIHRLLDISGSTLPTQSYLSIREVISLQEERARRIIKSKIPEISVNVLEEASRLSALYASGLGKIMPFLVDPHINEFYIDGPKSHIYLDHEQHGRCQTNYLLTSADLETIKTRLRLESTQRLDEYSPTLKTELISDQFHVRATMDVRPLAYNGPYLDIRKFYLKSLSIPDLIHNGTLNSTVASFVYFCLINRLNIIAIGEPGSGKTTLINAFDMLTPSNWRKITIEDAIESIPQQHIGKHQLRLQVESYNTSIKKRSKTFEITKLLHRSPDYLYLGEIQTAEHSLAMFHALSAGLKGLQTCHGASPEDLLIRWIYHHNVPLPCLSAVDVILFMKREFKRTNNSRQLVRVCEINQDELAKAIAQNTVNTSELITDLFRRNPKGSTLELLEDLYESQIVRKIRNHRHLSKSQFQSQIQSFSQALTSLCVLGNTSNEVVSTILNRISMTMETAKEQNTLDITKLIEGLSRSKSYDTKI